MADYTKDTVFYTDKEVAAILRLHPRTIRRYINAGKIQAFSGPHFTSSYRISQEELNSFINSNMERKNR